MREKKNISNKKNFLKMEPNTINTNTYNVTASIDGESRSYSGLTYKDALSISEKILSELYIERT